MQNIIFFLELIGTVAFAISGAVVGIQKRMDVFGVAILAMTTAVGGGIIRDIILNVTPPAAFREPIFTLTSIAVGIIVFLFVKHHFKPHLKEAYDALLRTMDAIGLGLFTVIGVEASFINDPGANVFLAVFVGVITGVGGGVVDILRGRGYNNVIGINFGGKPQDADKFADLPSEMWCTFPISEVSLLNDSGLFHELTDRRFSYDRKARRQVESKDSYKARNGGKSPDKADSVLMLFYEPKINRPMLY